MQSPSDHMHIGALASAVKGYRLPRLPGFEKLAGAHQQYLLLHARAIHRHQRLMTGVGGTAERVLDEYHAETAIDRVEHRRKNTDIGLGAADDQASHAFLLQKAVEPRMVERRIGRLVDDRSRWNEASQFRDKVEVIGSQVLPGRGLPAPIIVLPLSRPVLGGLRRDEAREYGSFLESSRNLDDDRQHALHPRRFPDAAAGENTLHIDADMDRIFKWRHLQNRLSRTIR